MRLITDQSHCEFIPENEEEKILTKALYRSLSNELKESKIFGADMVNLNESGDLYIITYV